MPRLRRVDPGTGHAVLWCIITFDLSRFPVSQVTLQVTLAILAATNAIGTLCTIFVPEAKRMTLKESALRSQSLFEKLVGGQVITHTGPHLAQKTAMSPVSLQVVIASDGGPPTVHLPNLASANPSPYHLWPI